MNVVVYDNNYYINLLEFLGLGCLLTSHLILSLQPENNYRLIGIIDILGSLIIFIHSLIVKKYILLLVMAFWQTIGLTLFIDNYDFP